MNALKNARGTDVYISCVPIQNNNINVFLEGVHFCLSVYVNEFVSCQSTTNFGGCYSRGVQTELENRTKPKN